MEGIANLFDAADSAIRVMIEQRADHEQYMRDLYGIPEDCI